MLLGEKWSAEEFDWLDRYIQLRDLGLNGDIIIDMAVSTDVKNNTKRIMIMDQSDLGLYDRKVLLNGFGDKTVDAYYKLMVDSAMALGAEREAAESQMKHVLDFEMMLANVSAFN